MLHVEPLTQGLVTARDASLLGPGELTIAVNGIYRPFDAALSPIGQRGQFGDSLDTTTHTITRIWGFEAGLTVITPEGITNNAEIQTGTVRSGTFALRVFPAVGPAADAHLTMFPTYSAAGALDNSSTYAAVAMRGYIRVGTLPNITTSIFFFRHGVTTRAVVSMTSAGQLLLEGNAGATLSINTWYLFELKYDSAGAGSVSLRIDGGTPQTVVPVNPVGVVDRFVFGKIGGTGGYNIFWDDLVFEAAATIASVNFPGPGHVIALSPDGDGFHDGEYIPDIGSDAFSRLTDPYVAVDTGYVEYNGTNITQEQTCTFEAALISGSPASVVNAVQVNMAVKSTTPGQPTNMRILARSGSTDADLSGTNLQSQDSDRYVASCERLSPFTLTAWTPAELNALEAGMQTQAATSKNRIATLWLEADVLTAGEAGGTISGLRATPFDDNATTIKTLLIARGTVWQSGVGGAWTTVRSGVTTGRRIEAIHFDDTYFCANGIDAGVIFENTAITVSHGMVPSEENDFTITIISGGGQWGQPGGPPVNNTYYHWITEYDSVRDIESSTTSNGIPTFVSAGLATTTVRVQIQYGQGVYPTKHNLNADRWRVYRSLPQEGTQPPVISNFPNGVLIGEVTIPGSPAITNFDDTGIISDTSYRFITISISGSDPLSIQRDTPPPIWSTGDIFEDSLVVNDIAEPRLVRYSFPGKPHSFPSLYFVGFDTKQQDVVTNIKGLGEVLLVGLRSQIWRLNYLPFETDADFNRGRSRQLISPNHGIMGPDAATLFAMADSAPRLAYVSHDGLYMTDGFNTRLLTQDLNWNTLVNVDTLSTSILVNAQHLWCLFFYFTRAGATGAASELLILSYHPQHIKEGGFLKVAGPAGLDTNAADYNSATFEAFAAFANVHEEDAIQGNTVLSAQTRLIYPKEGSLDSDTHVDKVRLLCGSHAGGGINTITLKKRKSDANIETEVSKMFTPSTTENRLISLDLHMNAEAFGALIQSMTTLNYIGFEHSTTERR